MAIQPLHCWGRVRGFRILLSLFTPHGRLRGLPFRSLGRRFCGFGCLTSGCKGLFGGFNPCLERGLSTSQVPPHPFSETPTTKRKVFRKLMERERSTHPDSLAPLANWCESALPHFDSLFWADIPLFTDVVLEKVATSYHTIIAPSQPSSSALVKKVKASLNSLPPPSHPAYPASMDTLKKHVKEWEPKVNEAATTKIHRCPVRKTRIERTINEALNPVERGEITLTRPGTTQLVSTPKEVSNIFSSTLLTLGGSLEYTPPGALVERLLTHSPTCPEPTKHSSLPDITWESFRNTLKKSKPNKAGGRDFTNNYTLHISPPPYPTV